MTPREVVRIDGKIPLTHPDIAAAALTFMSEIALHVKGITIDVTREAYTVTQADTSGWDQAVRDGEVEDSLTRRAQWDADAEKIGGSE